MDRKRQRRQTAGGFLQNVFAGRGKKKSTAQPRPQIVVPPRGIGPVIEPNDNDVLSGRGGRINAHKGNVQFRELVAERKKDYLAKSTKKLEKAHIAADIVYYIRGLEPSGRFLKEDADGAWWDIGDQKAIKKVGQALREDAPDIRTEIDTSEHDIDTDEKKESPAMRANVAVSGRGAKIVTGSRDTETTSNVAVIACQEIAPPKAYQKIVPTSVIPSFSNNAAPSVSGAATAAMAQEDDHFEVPGIPGDTAFGRPFHPPRVVGAQREASEVSGMSANARSGMSSAISALTDPQSTVSEKYQRDRARLMNARWRERDGMRTQPQQYQQPPLHWAEAGQRHLPPTNSMTSSDPTVTRQFLSSTGLGSSLNRPPAPPTFDGASVTENSLMGGGIQDGSQLSGLSQSMANVLNLNHHHPGDLEAPNRYAQHHNHTMAPAPADARSVASNSLHSHAESSLPSMPGSVLSHLSDTLVALDLAEPNL